MTNPAPGPSKPLPAAGAEGGGRMAEVVPGGLPGENPQHNPGVQARLEGPGAPGQAVRPPRPAPPRGQPRAVAPDQGEGVSGRGNARDKGMRSG